MSSCTFVIRDSSLRALLIEFLVSRSMPSTRSHGDHGAGKGGPEKVLNKSLSMPPCLCASVLTPNP